MKDKKLAEIEAKLDALDKQAKEKKAALKAKLEAEAKDIEAVAKEAAEKLKAQKKRREQAVKTRERKADTRRKILWGSLIMAEMAKEPGDENLKRTLKDKLDKFLTRDIDRELFDFDDTAVTPAPAPAPQPK